jgi:hypothetical protein
MNPGNDETITPTGTEGFVQSFAVSVYDGYTCTKPFTVSMYIMAVGSYYTVPTLNTFILTTGVTTRSESWPEVEPYTLINKEMTIVSPPQRTALSF